MSRPWRSNAAPASMEMSPSSRRLVRLKVGFCCDGVEVAVPPLRAAWSASRAAWASAWASANL
eukprot:1020693-Pyramimonas_sp.AAC.1